MKNHFARRQFLRTASASLFTGGLMQSETSGAQSSFQAAKQPNWRGCSLVVVLIPIAMRLLVGR